MDAQPAYGLELILALATLFFAVAIGVSKLWGYISVELYLRGVRAGRHTPSDDDPQLGEMTDRQWRRFESLWPPSPRAAPAEPSPADGHPLDPRVWLRAVNDEPDRTPHLAVAGPTGSGKSTLVLAILAARAGLVAYVLG